MAVRLKKRKLDGESIVDRVIGIKKTKKKTPLERKRHSLISARVDAGQV